MEDREKSDRQLRTLLVSQGDATFEAGRSIESCPDFVDPDMAVYWKIGWERAQQRREEEKQKRAVNRILNWIIRLLEGTS